MQRIKIDMNKVSNQRHGKPQLRPGDKKNSAMHGLGERIIWNGGNSWCRGLKQECGWHDKEEEGE